MVLISMPGWLAKREGLKLDSECNEQSYWHVSSFTTIGAEFIIATEKGSFYSYLFDIKEGECFLGLLQQALPGEHKYLKMESASVLAKLSNVAEKARWIIEYEAEDSDSISIKHVMEILNGIPWKFLGSKSPAQVRE